MPSPGTLQGLATHPLFYDKTPRSRVPNASLHQDEGFFFPE